MDRMGWIPILRINVLFVAVTVTESFDVNRDLRCIYMLQFFNNDTSDLFDIV